MAIFRPKESRRAVAPRTVAIVRDYLHANAESQVSIADLAQAAGVSGTQVIRAFSAETGISGDQLSVTPALLTTLAHFTTSASRIFRNASGEVMSGSAP